MADKDNFGLDKDARNRAKAAREAQEKEKARLDPDFPFVCLPFNPDFFNFPANPVPREDAPATS